MTLLDRLRAPRAETLRANIIGHICGAFAGSGLTYFAYFDDRFPLAWALLPFIVAVILGTMWARITAMVSFLVWPVVISSIGLIGIGLDAALVGLGACGILITLLGLTAVAGLTGATMALLCVPVFPASPLLPLMDSLKDLPWALIFLVVIMIITGLLEVKSIQHGSPDEARSCRLAVMAVMFIVVSLGQSLPHRPDTKNDITEGFQSRWYEIPAPVGLTPLTRWIQLRDQLPRNGTIVLGENIIDAEDIDGLSFWCRAVAAKNLTLYLGVSEPYRFHRRSALWMLDRDICAVVQSPDFKITDARIARARYGIPWVTGTWTLMPATPLSLPDAIQPDVLLSSNSVFMCLEAFLPWAWFHSLLNSPPTHNHENQQVQHMIVVANDTAFGRHAAMISTLRRKVAGTVMTFLNHSIKRPFSSVVFAEAERTYLVDQYTP
ncbi:MAG: hypothetical protein OXC62_15260 [Aestuariivita sp.]|nr:hypothetical protein [Aestuariivita sp.]